MDSKTVIRPTEPKDIAALRRLIVTTWHDTYDDSIGRDRVKTITDTWHATGRLEDELHSPDCISLVAEENETLVGHGLIKRHAHSDVCLSRLYVLPQHQGAGIGRQLLKELEDRLTDCHSLCLEVEESNLPAQRFYEKHGFALLRRKSGCGDQSEIPTLVLQKSLTSVVTNNTID